MKDENLPGRTAGETTQAGTAQTETKQTETVRFRDSRDSTDRDAVNRIPEKETGREKQNDQEGTEDGKNGCKVWSVY